ncbi:MAG: response regulator, partial [Saprospiraceae bacterium]|nr:response regulator [Saprospiraceae bacterium]
LQLSQRLQDSSALAETHANLGELALSNNDHQLANQHFRTANAIFKQLSEGETKEIAQLKKHQVHNKRVRGILFFLIGFAGVLAAFVSVLYKKKQKDNLELKNQIAENQRQQYAIEELMKEQDLKNTSLNLLNRQLVNEMGERESMEKTSYAKDKFLATISHEMRTPLNAITGLLHLLLENNPRPDQAEQLRTLQFSANELVVFINDVLDFSKIEVGKLDGQQRAFDILALSERLFKGFEAKAMEKNLLLHHSIDAQIPEKLMGNEARFHQILFNLFQNCCETTDSGLIQMALLFEAENEKEIILKLIVETTDGGVERKLINYDAEAAINDAWNDNFENWTLSLAMTKKMVELQHGRLMVENVFGEATKFTVLLPFRKLSAHTADMHPSDTFDRSVLSGNVILLVEDNKINQVIVSKMLRKYGMTIVTADNGAVALDKLEHGRFDLVLMDIQMPVMDGYRATTEIRNHANRALRKLPIIALTSSAYLTEKEKAFLFGMNDHVGKPFSPDELLEKIAACLQLNSSPSHS